MFAFPLMIYIYEFWLLNTKTITNHLIFSVVYDQLKDLFILLRA